MQPAFRNNATNQVASAARTSAFTGMTQQVDFRRTVNVLMSSADAPARWHMAARAAGSRLEHNASHQLGYIKIMLAFYHQT